MIAVIESNINDRQWPLRFWAGLRVEWVFKNSFPPKSEWLKKRNLNKKIIYVTCFDEMPIHEFGKQPKHGYQ